MALLKTTYRLDTDGHPDLYQHVDDVKQRLRLDIPVTLYQSQNNPQSNAALFYIDGERHVVFSGPVLSLLNADETKSIIAHELAHYHLWSMENKEFLVVDRIMQAAAGDCVDSRSDSAGRPPVQRPCKNHRPEARLR